MEQVVHSGFAVDIFDPNRLGKITGSRCSPLFPVKSAEVGRNTLAKELASEKYWGYYDESLGSRHTEHGKFSEKYAFEHYQRHYDKSIIQGGWREKGECGGTTDAEADDYGLDFKCATSLMGWQKYMFDGIDTDQINQCRWYMYLTGKPKWIIAAYLLETNWMAENGLVYPVPHEKRMILVEVFPDAEWLEKLQPAVDDVISRRDKYVAVLEAKFGKR
jgi:hypothetical protein